MIPGEIAGPDDPVVVNAGRCRVSVDVENTGDRPVQVGSHFHFAEANDALRFDRATARGRRLDIPAGTAVRFEPGISQVVDLVELAGRRVVRGLRGEVAGSLDRTTTAPGPTEATADG